MKRVVTRLCAALLLASGTLVLAGSTGTPAVPLAESETAVLDAHDPGAPASSWTHELTPGDARSFKVRIYTPRTSGLKGNLEMASLEFLDAQGKVLGAQDLSYSYSSVKDRFDASVYFLAEPPARVRISAQADLDLSRVVVTSVEPKRVTDIRGATVDPRHPYFGISRSKEDYAKFLETRAGVRLFSTEGVSYWHVLKVHAVLDNVIQRIATSRRNKLSLLDFYYVSYVYDNESPRKDSSSNHRRNHGGARGGEGVWMDDALSCNAPDPRRFDTVAHEFGHNIESALDEYGRNEDSIDKDQKGASHSKSVCLHWDPAESFACYAELYATNRTGYASWTDIALNAADFPETDRYYSGIFSEGSSWDESCANYRSPVFASAKPEASDQRGKLVYAARFELRNDSDQDLRLRRLGDDAQPDLATTWTLEAGKTWRLKENSRAGTRMQDFPQNDIDFFEDTWVGVYTQTNLFVCAFRPAERITSSLALLPECVAGLEAVGGSTDLMVLPQGQRFKDTVGVCYEEPGRKVVSLIGPMMAMDSPLNGTRISREACAMACADSSDCASFVYDDRVVEDGRTTGAGNVESGVCLLKTGQCEYWLNEHLRHRGVKQPPTWMPVGTWAPYGVTSNTYGHRQYNKCPIPAEPTPAPGDRHARMICP